MLKYSLDQENLRQMETQFEFLRYAFRKLSSSRAKQFFAEKRKFDISKVTANLEKFPELGADTETIAEVRQRAEKKILKKWGGENRELYQEQYVPDDLNKSELLLLVALSESHLKEFYESLLRAEPRRAFAKSGKQENLREMFADNVEESRKSKFFQKVGEGEVDRFDHTPFDERMKFLKEAYEPKMAEGDIRTACDLIDRRHMISHRWTDRNKVKQVSPPDLGEARKVFRSILGNLFLQASKNYPRHFNH